MIFVTVGTQPNGFLRLLNALEKLISKYSINDEVIAQIGYSEFSSNRIKCVPFVEEEAFKRHIEEADVIITHAGSGALFNSIDSGKKIIAVARLHEYNEMADNHQLELLEKLVEGGYVLDGTYSLEDAWLMLPNFKPRGNDFENSIVEVMDSWIAEWLK